jgi:membrane protein DedA with SNARE-associated domain
VAWGGAVVLLGYAAGASYGTIESRFGTAAAIVLATVAVLGLAGWRLRRHVVDRRRALAEAG